MSEQDFVSRVKYIIAFKGNVAPSDVYTVWLCKTLQNNKGLFSTNIDDSKYFEATYNGDKDELYLDIYIKYENKCIADFSKLTI